MMTKAFQVVAILGLLAMVMGAVFGVAAIAATNRASAELVAAQGGK